jgi:hypothetical protein
MLQDINTFNNARFNDLPSIESADAEMKRQDKLTTAFNVLGPIFLKHSMHEKWGLTLLHKHWPVGND